MERDISDFYFWFLKSFLWKDRADYKPHGFFLPSPAFSSFSCVKMIHLPIKHQLPIMQVGEDWGRCLPGGINRIKETGIVQTRAQEACFFFAWHWQEEKVLLDVSLIWIKDLKEEKSQEAQLGTHEWKGDETDLDRKEIETGK